MLVYVFNCLIWIFRVYFFFYFFNFYNNIDSAIILKNASTQFADGGEFGFGAEIGISTDKLHVRGPVGAKHLTTFKYIVHGNGQVRP